MGISHDASVTSLENIAILRINLEMRQDKNKQIKEVIMNLSPASIAIARNMLQEGLPTDLINKVTGLSLAEIIQL
jgi:predicted transposase YdaD